MMEQPIDDEPPFEKSSKDPKNKSKDIVEQPVDIELTLDGEPVVKPVVAHVSEPVIQKIVVDADVHQQLLTQDDPKIIDDDTGNLVPEKVNESVADL
jgi:hypothetical protein